MTGGGQGVKQREFFAKGAGLFEDIAEDFAPSRKGPVHRAL